MNAKSLLTIVILDFAQGRASTGPARRANSPLVATAAAEPKPIERGSGGEMWGTVRATYELMTLASFANDRSPGTDRR